MSSIGVCYMCAEFGTDSNLPTYAGGLGVLAGDTMLEAAGKNKSMCGIGLLYNGFHQIQKFNSSGIQTEVSTTFDPRASQALRPVQNSGGDIILQLNAADETINFMAYQQRLADKTLQLFLTCDIDGTPDSWRSSMNDIYCCGDEDQLRQQLLLGIGGVAFLSALKMEPEIYHFQEGRPIFAHWEIVRKIMLDNQCSFADALVKARERIVYTNHTLVPDGNLVYDLNMVRHYADSYAKAMGINTDELLTPGKIPNSNNFSITKYALAVSKKANGVSKQHTLLSKKIWPKNSWESITNGVHMPRWQHSEYLDYKNMDDLSLWESHRKLKREFARRVRDKSSFSYDPDVLVIGWARRITPYKQVLTIFEDIERLKKILTNTPAQILVAGKAHQGDNWGKETIQKIMKVMSTELSHFALYVPDYNISLAYAMTAGVDLWLNTPEHEKEASGTSGMKACANGVINLTTPEGWALEADFTDAGFCVQHENLANNIYTTLEDKIVPSFLKRDERGVPTSWVQMMRKSMDLAQNFSAERMLSEYEEKLYSYSSV